MMCKMRLKKKIRRKHEKHVLKIYIGVVTAAAQQMAATAAATETVSGTKRKEYKTIIILTAQESEMERQT